MTTKRQFKPVDEQMAYLRKGAAEVIREEDLRAKLEASARTGKPLRVKLGVDPTAPDIHLGHMVVIEKLKQFQLLGHTAIFLIGDFTAMVGDPTGQSETRPPLTLEQVKENATTYLQQVFKILDPKKTEIRYNSEWLGKLAGHDMIHLCAHYRLARMLEREDFRSRLSGNLPIAMHELLYPLLQAYDSVALVADVELGATEQKFNLLVGRDIQREYGQPSQVALTMPILVGLDGKRKMSKSLGNYIGITESPNEMFAKIMSIPDDLMWSYFELLTLLPDEDIRDFKLAVREGRTNPKTVKIALAKWIVKDFHDAQAAEDAAKYFQHVFSERKAPAEVQTITVKNHGSGAFYSYRQDGDVITTKRLQVSSSGVEKWIRFLLELEQVASASEAERIVKGRGFEVDEKIVNDPSARVNLNQPATYALRIGKKKFVRILVQ